MNTDESHKWQEVNKELNNVMDDYGESFMRSSSLMKRTLNIHD